MHTASRIASAIVLLMSLSLMMVFALACSDTTETDLTPTAGKEASISGDPGSLVVYSGRSESLIGPLIDTFQTMTGIDVSVKYGSTGEIAATILEEGSNSPADVFFAQDPGGLAAVTPLLEPLRDPIIKLAPTWATSPEKLWIGVSGRARVVVYNKQGVKESGIPKTLDGFTDPKWKKRIGWAPSNASFQAMVTTMRVIWGEEKTRHWLSSIQANEPKVYLKNTPIVAAAASGEIDVGLVNHYYLHRFMKEDGESFGARNFFMDSDGPGSVVLVTGVGILKTTDNRQNGEKFIQFLLSNIAQQYFASQTFEYPLIDEVATHRLLPSIDELLKPTIDMASLSDVEGTQRLLRDIGIIP